MRDRDVASVLAATILAIFGFAAVRSYAPDPTAAFVSVNAQAATIESPTTTTTPAGIDPTVFRTLQATGDAWILPESEAETQLPDAIVRVLERHDAVLKVVGP